MGIPYYFSYLIKNHSLIISKLQFLNNNIHNLFLDCNSLIYDTLNYKNFQNKQQYKRLLRLLIHPKQFILLLTEFRLLLKLASKKIDAINLLIKAIYSKMILYGIAVLLLLVHFLWQT